MDGFDAAELACLRAEVATSFDKTAAILTQATSSDRRGGSNEDWVSATEVSVSCSLEIAKPPAGLVEAGRVTSLDYRRAELPHGTAVTTLNRLRVDGRTYEVIGVEDEDSYALSVLCHCKRIKP